MLTTLSSLVGIIATVSISGPRARSGSVSAAPSLSLPMKAASTRTNERPRTCSGRKSTSGSCSIRPIEWHYTGTVSIHSRQAPRISRARSIGQNRQPA